MTVSYGQLRSVPYDDHDQHQSRARDLVYIGNYTIITVTKEISRQRRMYPPRALALDRYGLYRIRI